MYVYACTDAYASNHKIQSSKLTVSVCVVCEIINRTSTTPFIQKDKRLPVVLPGLIPHIHVLIFELLFFLALPGHQVPVSVISCSILRAGI